MKITILLDHDLEGFSVFLQAGLKETGWDQVFTIEFKRLRDFGLPENCSDHDLAFCATTIHPAGDRQPQL